MKIIDRQKYGVQFAFALLIALLALADSVKAKDFMSIVPLKSMKSNVEKLLGKENEWGFVRNDFGKISVRYLEEPCTFSKDDCECLVPLGTVLSIFVRVDKPLNIKEEVDDLSTFTKKIDNHLTTISYSNFDEGVVYEVDKAGEIYTISYFPSKKDCEILEGKNCSDLK